MPTALVLGGGMVGSVMAADLAARKDYEVAIADRNPEAVSRTVDQVRELTGTEIDGHAVDLADAATLRRLVEPADIVLGALASPIGFQTLRTVIEAKRNFCDICFMPENALELHELAQAHGVTAVVDCGIAPGVSNMMAGFAAQALDRCERIEIYVGGLPVERHWPFEYKAGFSPHDVIEEYTRPARLVEQGQIVIRDALSEPEMMDFPGIGTLVAFNTDGLRTLADTLEVPNMIEKTLRYPGHIELMRVLRAMGHFSHDEIEVGGQKIRPIDVTSALMFPMWQYETGEADLTVMRVTAHGEQSSRPVTLQWDMLDYLDDLTGFTSMSRTTAFPCTIVADMIARGQFSEPGVYAPERLGRETPLFDHVMAELEQRGVQFDVTMEESPDS